MTEFKLKYNPYMVESVMKINNKEITEDSRLYKLKNERMQIWLDNLLPILLEECNDDEINIEFHGITLDFEDLQSHVDEYCCKNPDIKIEVKHIKAKDTSDRVKRLDELFQKMQKECPFEDLKSEEIKNNFIKARDSEFEVSIIATMSAGKSTLINALLGRELMPSKNEACTATITRIKDIDNKKDFSAQALDIENRLIKEYKRIDIETMKKLNDNEKVAFIKMEGDIPFIFSKDIQLVLFDTPGPNNSRTDLHREYAYEIIKEKSKPMVIYVLNATQLAVNDDYYLLSTVAEAMKVGGKQSKDRFIFLVNKIDTFDTEKSDSIGDTIKSVKSYLEKQGIKEPNIYLASAELAKIIRLKNNGYKLTDSQVEKLFWHKRFNKNEELHLSQYAPLNKNNKEILDDRMKEARIDGDVYEEALIHTGIPAVEIAINEYLDKYAITAKVKMAVDTFIKKVEEKQVINILMDQLNQDEKAREELNTKLKMIKEQIEGGRKAGKFKDKIKKLEVNDQFDTQVEKIRAKISKSLPSLTNGNDKLTTQEAGEYLKKLQGDVIHLETDVRTDLNQIIQETIIENAERFIQEYNEELEKLFADSVIGPEGYKTSLSLNYIKADVPDAGKLIHKYKFTEQVAAGEEWVKNHDRKWYKPWTLFQKKGWWRTIYKDVDYVSKNRIYDEFIRPITGNFNENLKRAKDEAKKEAESFKEFFLKEIDQLDKRVDEKREELQELSASHKNVGKSIKENKAKKEWLEKFLNELEEIIEI